MEIKAEGVARCNEMYTTSYPSITYTRHCKYSKNIDVIEDILLLLPIFELAALVHRLFAMQRNIETVCVDVDM